MERLTIRIDGEAYIEKVANKYCEDVCSSRNRCNDCPIRDAFNKLAHYEDLEEQGRLIELPCKVGDEFWELNDVHDIPAIYPRYAHTLLHCIYVLERLGRRAFLTKEEAEAKLKELKEGVE